MGGCVVLLSVLRMQSALEGHLMQFGCFGL